MQDIFGLRDQLRKVIFSTTKTVWDVVDTAMDVMMKLDYEKMMVKNGEINIEKKKPGKPKKKPDVYDTQEKIDGFLKKR